MRSSARSGDVFIALDGRFWQKTDENTWTLRGDLTGPPGSNTFTGSAEPPRGLGKDGDVYVRDDGTLWTKANGVWTYSGVDLTGPPGTKLIPGDVAEGASPSASLGEVGDIFFNLDGRVWEKTDETTWTSRGDITGPPGASLIPGVVAPDALPPSERRQGRRHLSRRRRPLLAEDGRNDLDLHRGPDGTPGLWRRHQSARAMEQRHRLRSRRLGVPRFLAHHQHRAPSRRWHLLAHVQILALLSLQAGAHV